MRSLSPCTKIHKFYENRVNLKSFQLPNMPKIFIIKRAFFLHLSSTGIMYVVLSTLCSCLQHLFSFVLHYQSIANLDYLLAASPNSYFTGLPLLIQPSELCIIHPQHVVDMKCRNTFSSNINNSCTEKREQNAKWVAD